jgi:hypothetical protein
MKIYLISKCIVFYFTLIGVDAFCLHKNNCFSKKSSSELHLFRRRGSNRDDSNCALEEKNEVKSIDQIEEKDKECDQLKESREKRSTLKFGGKMIYESKPFPIPNDLSRLHDFMSSKETEMILLSGGKNVTEIEYLNDDSLISDYMDRWKEEAKKFGGEPPQPGDSIIRVVPSGIKILTVSILPKSVVGTKVIRKGLFPEFQAILVDDIPTAQGPMPLVRLFDLIVNSGSKDNRNESAFLKLWVRMQEDNTAIFVAESQMHLEFTFPSFILIPIKKEQSEKICSDAILNALKINLVPAIESMYEKYLEFSAQKEDRGERL